MWLCKCPSLMTHRKRRWWRWLNLAKLACFSCAMKSSLCFTFLLMRTGSSYRFWNMPEKWVKWDRPPHLFYAVTSVLFVRLPLTWLPRTNSTQQELHLKLVMHISKCNLRQLAHRINSFVLLSISAESGRSHDKMWLRWLFESEKHPQNSMQSH